MEIGIIQAIQSIRLEGFLGAFTDALILFITFFGESVFILLALFIIYWCIDKKTGDFLVFSVYLSAGINFTLKDIFVRQRPCFSDACRDGTIRHLKVDGLLVDTNFSPTSYSFPSGHASIGGALYLGLAKYLKKRWITIVSVVLCVLIALSRVYIGVHYPSDVAVGLICALICSFGFGTLYLKFYKYRYYIYGGISLVFLVSAIITANTSTYAIFALGIGYIIGNILEERYVKFQSNSVWWKRILRFFVGLGVTGLVFLPCYFIFGINGAWVVATLVPTIVASVVLAPLSFKLLKL